jgi:hypothetical protein
MMVHAKSSYESLILLFRRTGATVCFLFGFGLLAVVMAGNASAEDRQAGDEDPQQGTAESVTGLLSPLTSVVESVVDPMASEPDSRPSGLTSVVRPIVEVVKPITAPVLQPVVATVTGSGATDVAEGPKAPKPPATVPAGRGTPITTPSQLIPQRPTQPPMSWGGPVRPAAASEATRRPDSSQRDGRHASAVLDQPAGLSGSGDPGGTPLALVGPISALLSSSGSATGSGGSHATDAAVLTPGSLPGSDDRGGRSPPRSVDGQSWFGYDARDRPS